MENYGGGGIVIGGPRPQDNIDRDIVVLVSFTKSRQKSDNDCVSLYRLKVRSDPVGMLQWTSSMLSRQPRPKTRRRRRGKGKTLVCDKSETLLSLLEIPRQDCLDSSNGRHRSRRPRLRRQRQNHGEQRRSPCGKRNSPKSRELPLPCQHRRPNTIRFHRAIDEFVVGEAFTGIIIVTCPLCKGMF